MHKDTRSDDNDVTEAEIGDIPTTNGDGRSSPKRNVGLEIFCSLVLLGITIYFFPKAPQKLDAYPAFIPGFGVAHLVNIFEKDGKIKTVVIETSEVLEDGFLPASTNTADYKSPDAFRRYQDSFVQFRLNEGYVVRWKTGLKKKFSYEEKPRSEGFFDFDPEQTITACLLLGAYLAVNSTFILLLRRFRSRRASGVP